MMFRERAILIVRSYALSRFADIEVKEVVIAGWHGAGPYFEAGGMQEKIC